jgi:riboflavin transporter FmnP
MTKSNDRRPDTRKLATIAILAAVASLLFLLEIPIVLFYKLDFSNLPVLLGTFAMGPRRARRSCFSKARWGFCTPRRRAWGNWPIFWWGWRWCCPRASSTARARAAAAPLTGMAVGGVCATIAGVLANVYILIPFYGAAYHMPVEQIIAMGQSLIPSLDTVWKFVFAITAPFNVLKWAAISVLGGLIYKPLSPLLHGRRRTVRENVPGRDADRPSDNGQA